MKLKCVHRQTDQIHKHFSTLLESVKHKNRSILKNCLGLHTYMSTKRHIHTHIVELYHNLVLKSVKNWNFDKIRTFFFNRFSCYYSPRDKPATAHEKVT